MFVLNRPSAAAIRRQTICALLLFGSIASLPALAQSKKPSQPPASTASAKSPNRTAVQPLAGPINISVDASEISRKIVHSRLVIPATPGPLTLTYPKWIPGEHGPTGPIVDLTGLHITANGQEIPWRRDPLEMFNFQVTVPAGASSIEARFDQLLPVNVEGFSSAASSTANMALLSWNQVMLTPAGHKSDDVRVHAQLKLPEGWQFGTALPGAAAGSTIDFKEVSFTTLVDSPVIMGRYFRRIDIGNDLGKPHYIDIAADSEAALAITEKETQGYRNLVRETGAQFGARHYNEYHFLLTLSDTTAHFGLEHHESSDDRIPERSLVDPERFVLAAELLPHEMVHSWNGKFRRPTGLATGEYESPMNGEMLWVYEGLTQYLGQILAPRAGLVTPEQFRELAADTAAALDVTAGRTWRPLQDTATAAQVLYEAPAQWESWRRSVDYYPEGFLIWLEIDTIIRQKTNNQKSLIDFTRAFHGGQSGAPAVVTYTFDDIVNGLNSVVANDWRAYLLDRLNSKAPRAPLGGITNSGWRLDYTDKAPELVRIREDKSNIFDARFSIGISTDEKGGITDAIVGSPAEKAGIAPGMKVVAVNGRAFSPTVMRDALRLGKSSKEPMHLIVSNGEFFKTYSLDYHGGERYATLVRDESKPDLLGEIIKPQAK